MLFRSNNQQQELSSTNNQQVEREHLTATELRFQLALTVRQQLPQAALLVEQPVASLALQDHSLIKGLMDVRALPQQRALVELLAELQQV